MFKLLKQVQYWKKYYNPRKLIFQHSTFKENVKSIEIIRMRNSYNIDTLTSDDIQEIFNIGVMVIQVWKGLNYLQNFENSPFMKVFEKRFTSR